ncbi:MAG: DNA topoisomerase I [Nanoarchaeota archaeon]|nr:DNA topoisomerase I [Nanoarchaeota archaeon]
MPRKKQKPREEKIAEEYFPVDKDDLKYSIEKEQREPKINISESREISSKEFTPEIKIKTEKEYRKLDKKSLEKVEKMPRKIPKRRSKRTSQTKKYSPQKTELKENGYELIITEKPQAAAKIASALGKSIQQSLNKVPYYEVERDSKKIVVACAVGHLFTLKQNTTGSDFPVFDIKWVPNHLALKKDFTKRYYDTILKLSKNAGSITIATDFDIEGEVIGMNITRFICGQEDANRMKFSTLTSEELNKSYENKEPHLDWGQAIAGETRHYLDWFYGINLSRALMKAIKSTGRFKIMSIGRVQGPALNLVVQKEKSIQSFKSQTYWQVFITVKNSKDARLPSDCSKEVAVQGLEESGRKPAGCLQVELKYKKDVFKKLELGKFENLVGKKANAETEKTEQQIPPNLPFNLTTLQTEAYRLYGITPLRTLQIAQSLYLASLISYPRTSSQKLPESVEYKSIKEKLAREYNAEKLVVKEKPVEGKKTDPAHPSIYPTGNRQILSGEEEKIYNLIVRRFLSLFCENAVIENKKITVVVEGLEFYKKGSSIRKKAWMEIYPIKMNEEEIPDLNGKVEIIDSRIDEKETQPPKRYSPASIISELEKRNLGTKATRASIVETLYDRGYIKEKRIEATPLGISLISTLEKYSPIIIEEELTRDFEKEMESIQKSKKDFKEKETKVVEKAKKTITKISKDLEKNEKEIGGELVKAQDEIREKERIENIITTCPLCKKGDLIINYSKKNRRYFVSCNKYPECKNTYTLPPNGLIKKTDKICEKCGFPILMRLTKGKKPWEFCFNPECPTNIERIEEYKKRQEEK